MIKKIFFALIVLLIIMPLAAQDFGFGFGDDADTSGGGGSSFGGGGSASFGGGGIVPTVSISGEVSAEMLGYYMDFDDAEKVQLGDIFSGKLNFSAGNAYADGVINLKLAPTESPISIDEAYARAYFGDLEIEGGLRKLSWGKADSMGPLDVVNPLDYSELTDLSNIANLKIARPMVHLSYRVGSFSKLEGVFVPTFQPMRYSESGRWAPAQMSNMTDTMLAQAQTLFAGLLGSIDFDDMLNIKNPDTSTLNYAQGGVRFTTNAGPADIGLQYYYGRITQPSYNIDISPDFSSVDVNLIYNPYHQIGIDWAQILFGFNIRAEFAVNLTEDLKGDDPTVYNPNLVWSLGFDRDLVWGINLNIQCNETIRLMHDKMTAGTPILGGLLTVPDIEADSDVTSTQIIAAISKSFFRDKLAVRIAAFWEIEEKDFLLIPSFIWTKDAIALELSGGIFGGNEDGQFGQYKDNSFIKLGVTYSF